MDSFVLGLDIGTTEIKAVLFSLDGKEIEISRKKNEIIELPNGIYEQDMNVLWDNLCIVIRNLIGKIGDKNIIGIGLSAQGEGCWLVDDKGKPVRTAILWNDARVSSIINDVSKEQVKKYKSITGSLPCPGAMSFIIKWLSINDKKSLDNAKYALFCKDWIRYKLTGEFFIEETDTSTSLLDLEKKEVSSEIFDMLNISEYYRLMPNLINSNSVAGSITKEAAYMTGLKEGISVSAGYIDVISSCIGAGALYENDVCSILGTSCVNEFLSNSFNLLEDSVSYLCYGDGEKYVSIVGNMAGTPNIDWITNTLFSDVENILKNKREFYDFIDEKIKDIPMGSNGVIYHPYIKNSGERAPFLDTNARASFFGINENTTRWDLLKAIYEGIAFSIKDCFQSYIPKKIFLMGGGANSTILAKIISDCMGVPIVISKSKELGAKGAAVSACMATGVFSTLKEALDAFKNETIEIYPNEKNTLFYNEYFQIYKNLRNLYKIEWERKINILNKFKLL